MEVCPYCKKPFKRLKSHLPHCKMKEQIRPDEEKMCQSKPATLPRAKKTKRPVTDSRTLEPALGTEIGKRNANLTWNKLEGTLKSSPLQDVALGKVSKTKAGKDMKKQIQLSSKMLENIEPRITGQGETTAPFYVSDSIAPGKGLSKVAPEPGESRSSETEAFLPLGPMEPSSSNQGGKYPSALPNDVQAMSAGFKLDRIDPSGQEFLVQLLDVPDRDYHNPPANLNYGTERAGTSLSSNKSDSKARDHISAVTDSRDCESQDKNVESQILGFQVSPVDTIQVKENQVKRPNLGVEVSGSGRNAEEGRPVTEMKEWASMSDDFKKLFSSDSAPVKKSQDEGPSLSIFMPKETPCDELLSLSQSHNQSLVSLALKCLQEEKAESYNHNQAPAIKALMERQSLASSEPRSDCQPQSAHPVYQQPLCSTWHHAFKNVPFTHQIAVVDKKTFPSSLGLEWFPELYPAYLGLGVLPGKPQYWNIMSQKSVLISPQGESLSEVPLLERSLTALRSLESPTRLTTSNFSLLRFLGAVQKGWIKCRTTVKSGVGGITMLFTGYFILCCNWSFRQLKLQRWRK